MAVRAVVSKDVVQESLAKEEGTTGSGGVEVKTS